MESIDLKRFRKIKNMSQIEASSFFKVSQAFISQIERGECPISDKIISKIEADNDWIEYKKNSIILNEPIEVYNKIDPWSIIKSQQDTINRLTEMLYEQNKKGSVGANMGAGDAAAG